MRIPGDSRGSGHDPGAEPGIGTQVGSRYSAVELRVLSALLSQPDHDGLEALEWMTGTAPWLAPAIDELRGLPLERWQAEHTRLFINGFPKTPCPPFESAYRHGFMGGTAVEELDRLYRRSGLESPGLSADYLGVMLEYAAWLEEDEDKSRAELRAALWREHLGCWLHRFAADLIANARLRLYQELGLRLARLSPEPERP